MRSSLTLLAVLLTITQLSAAEKKPDPWGIMLGRIVYNGKAPVPQMRPITIAVAPGQPAAIDDESLVVGKNGGLGNVFVYLWSKPSKIHPGYTNSPPEKQTLTIRNLCFEPHAQILWTHDELELFNPDPQNVQSFNYGSPLQGFNTRLPFFGRELRKLKASENLPHEIGSNMYPWMSANLLVRDNPYFCVTDERGIFCITDLPLNEPHEFIFWHERCGYLGGVVSQAADPAQHIGLNPRGRLTVTFTEPVLDLGEFRVEPLKFK